MTGFKGSRKSLKNYFLWREERAAPALNAVEKTLKLKGARILDVGCGYGSLMRAASDRGAQVWGVETDQRKLTLARKLLKTIPSSNIKLVRDENLPFRDGFFDAVFLFDVIEHVKNPKISIDEAFRVLKPGGILYVEFTPYYSIAGHHLYDFFKLPLHLFLSQEAIKRIVFGKNVNSFITHQQYWDQYLSLNKLRISDFQSMTSKFHKIRERFIIKYPGLFEINIPYLIDFLTMSFEGLYRKG